MLSGKPAIYEEDGMLILRCWRRDTLSLYPQLLGAIRQFNNVKSLLVEFEFASFGDFWVTSVFPILLLVCRLLGKRITLVLHQVLSDIWSLNGHLGLRFDSRQYRLFSNLLPLFYAGLTRCANATLVLEEEFKKRLRGLAPLDRVSVIPHGVETHNQIMSKKVARKKLGLNPNEFILLSFGFVTWYKGTDILARALAHTKTIHGKPLRLVIAGGESTTQKHKAHYQSYFSGVKALIRGKAHITMTDFVPDEKIGLYFAAADMVAFPYRTVMSSSGPLSLALSYGKPIVLSQAMQAYAKTADVKESIASARLPVSTLFMPENGQRMGMFLEKVSRPNAKKKLTAFAKMVAEKRSFSRMADAYYTVLTSPALGAQEAQPALA